MSKDENENMYTPIEYRYHFYQMSINSPSSYRCEFQKKKIPLKFYLEKNDEDLFAIYKFFY